MIQKLNNKQLIWLTKAIALYRSKVDVNSPHRMSMYSVLLGDSILRRLDDILHYNYYDSDGHSYDMRCINLLKEFYINHSGRNVYLPNYNNYIMGADVATGNDISNTTLVRVEANGKHIYI